jgi:uncharacterized Tic20 family protein
MGSLFAEINFTVGATFYYFVVFLLVLKFHNVVHESNVNSLVVSFHVHLFKQIKYPKFLVVDVGSSTDKLIKILLFVK